MTGVLFYLPNARQLSVSGRILPGWYIQFYLTETDTPTPVYSDGALENSLGNEVVADSAGMMQAIYMNPAVVYRVLLYDADDVLIDDIDPFDVSRGSGGVTPSGSQQIAFGRISSGGAIVGQSEGIASVEMESGPGIYKVNFESSYFAFDPSVVATPFMIGEGDGTYLMLQEINTDYVILRTRRMDTDAEANTAFHIHAITSVST